MPKTSSVDSVSGKKQPWKRQEARIYCELCNSWYQNNVHQKLKHESSFKHKNALKSQIEVSKRASNLASKHVNVTYSYHQNSDSFQLPDWSPSDETDETVPEENHESQLEQSQETETKPENSPVLSKEESKNTETETTIQDVEILLKNKKSKLLKNTPDLFGSYSKLKSYSDSDSSDDENFGNSENTKPRNSKNLGTGSDSSSNDSDSDSDGWV